MHRNPRSNDYYDGSVSHGHGSHREPLNHSSYANEIDQDYLSSRSGYGGTQGKSHHVDSMGLKCPSTHHAQHGKRRGSHYMDNVGAYYHSTHGGHHGKQGSHHHSNDNRSDDHCPHSKHHGKRSTHHHVGKKEALHPKPHHEKASGKKDLREQLFQQALKPFNKDTGTPYPCSQTDIDFHRQKKFPAPNKGPFETNHEATKEVMWHNDTKRSTPPHEKAAIKNLLSAASGAQDGLILGPDIAIKAFTDLDIIFFAGRLRKNVIVRWRSDIKVPFRAWGICDSHRAEKGQCRIDLNASMIFKEGWTNKTPRPFESMIGTLLHEMCHAYERVRSADDVDPGDGHDKKFGTRIAVVHKRAVQILGLWAIERGEPYRQHHFFMPGCLEGYRDDYSSAGYEGSGHVGDRKQGADRIKEGSGKAGSSGERNDGHKDNRAGKDGGNSKHGGSSTKPKRNHKGTDCVIM